MKSKKEIETRLQIKKALQVKKEWMSLDEVVIQLLAMDGDSSRGWNEEYKRLRSEAYQSLCGAVLNFDDEIVSDRHAGEPHYRLRRTNDRKTNSQSRSNYSKINQLQNNENKNAA